MHPEVAYIEKFPLEIQDKILRLLLPRDLIAVAVAWPNTITRSEHLILPSLTKVSVMFEKQSLERLSWILGIKPLADQVRKLTVHTCHFLPPDELCHVESLSFEKWGYRTVDREQCSDDEHSDDKHSDDEHSDDEHSDDEHSDDEHSDDEHSDDEQSSVEQSDKQTEEFRALLDNQSQLILSDSILAYFKEAMGKLTNCEKILISDEQLRDGICSPSDSLKKFNQGPLSLNSETSVKFVSHVLSTVLRAASHSQESSNPPLESSLRSLTISIGFSYSLLNCNGVRPDMLPSLEHQMTSIRQLSIALDCNFLQDSGSSKPGADLRKFIEALPEVRDFDLQVVGQDWLEKPFGLFSSIKIQKLERLALECLKCREKELNDFIQRHEKTLTRINFERIHLDGDSPSWDNIIQNIENGPNNVKIIMRL